MSLPAAAASFGSGARIYTVAFLLRLCWLERRWPPLQCTMHIAFREGRGAATLAHVCRATLAKGKANTSYVPDLK